MGVLLVMGLSASRATAIAAVGGSIKLAAATRAMYSFILKVESISLAAFNYLFQWPLFSVHLDEGWSQSIVRCGNREVNAY